MWPVHSPPFKLFTCQKPRSWRDCTGTLGSFGLSVRNLLHLQNKQALSAARLSSQYLSTNAESCYNPLRKFLNSDVVSKPDKTLDSAWTVSWPQSRSIIVYTLATVPYMKYTCLWSCWNMLQRSLDNIPAYGFVWAECNRAWMGKHSTCFWLFSCGKIPDHWSEILHNGQVNINVSCCEILQLTIRSR